jgi:Polyketide cyclase / dehydrase and lipid transport
VKYADCPTISVSIDVAAPRSEIWALVSDIGLSSRFSAEVSGVEWIDGSTAPALGARFAGHSAHDAIGQWTTTCIVTSFESGHRFEWCVIGRDGDVSTALPAPRGTRRCRLDSSRSSSARRTKPSLERK